MKADQSVAAVLSQQSGKRGQSGRVTGFCPCVCVLIGGGPRFGMVLRRQWFMRRQSFMAAA
jgi:hypothetical protein